MILQRRNSAVVLLLLMLFSMPGCTKTEAPAPVVPKPQMTEQEVARKMQQIRLDKYKEKFGSIQGAIRNYPERYDEWILHLEDMIYAAEGTAYAVKAQKLLDEQIQVRESAGKKHLEQIASRVKSLMAEGDPLAAERELDKFDPDDTFGKTGAHQEWLNLCEQVDKRQRAEVEFDRITRRARAYRRQEELAAAIGLLESFSSDYKNTKEYEEVRTTIDEYLVEYKATRSAQAAELAIEWEDLTIDSYLSAFRASASDPDAEVWTEDGGEVVGNNSSSGPAQLEIGEDSWEEYVVELEIQLVAGDAVNLGITAGMRPGSALKKYDVHSFDADEEEWIRMRIELKEGLVSITDLDSLDALGENTRPYFPMGGLAILLRPEDAVRVRNIRYKVFQPAEGEEPIEGEEPVEGEEPIEGDAEEEEAEG